MAGCALYDKHRIGGPDIRKVALIIHSLGIGGMERVMATLANDFANREGVEVHLLLIGRERAIAFEFNKAIVVHTPSFAYNPAMRSLSALRTMLFIRKTIRQIGPDSILSFGEIWNNLVLLALAGRKENIFISDRSKPGKNLGRLHNYLRGKLYPKASGFIAQTKKAKEFAEQKKLNSNIQVIGNPIRQLSVPQRSNEYKTVLSVGRLIDTKHFDQLIEIFAACDADDWKLVIVGGDAIKQNNFEKFNKLIREKNIKNVKLEGYQTDIERYYETSDIFAFTSSSEGFPNVVGEALSAGLPVVAYDCVAGPSDLIEDGKSGYIVPLFDKVRFKQKLQRLISDKKHRDVLSSNAKHSIQKFGSAYIAQQFYNFIIPENRAVESTH